MTCSGQRNVQGSFVIIPGATYDARMRYYPWEEGDNVGHLRIVTDNGASADVIVIASTVVSVEEDEQANIGWGAFPNPSSDVVSYTLPPSVHQSTIRVYSITGELVWQADATGLDEFTWNGRTPNGQSIAPGSYSVCILSGNTLLCTSFIRSNP